MNKEGETYDKVWAEMGQDEVQDHLNESEKYDISDIYILLHYWEPSNITLMVKVNGLHTLADDYLKAEYLKFYYLDTIALYIIRSSLGF